MHTRFCTVLLVTVPQFCAPLYGNSVQQFTFADFFCDPFVPRRSKKERLRSVRRSTLTACSAELNRFGLRFVRAHLTGVCLRSTLTACSAEVNRFGLRFVRVHLTGVCLRSVRRSPKTPPPVHVEVEPPLISLQQERLNNETRQLPKTIDNGIISIALGNCLTITNG